MLSSSAVGQHLYECEQTQYLASLQNQFTELDDLPLPSDNLSPIEILVSATFLPFLKHFFLSTINLSTTLVSRPVRNYIFLRNYSNALLAGSYFCIINIYIPNRFTQISLTSRHTSSAFSLCGVYLCCTVLYDFFHRSEVCTFVFTYTINEKNRTTRIFQFKNCKQTYSQVVILK